MVELRKRPVAVITGGRTGLGRGCALALADRDFDLVLIDLYDDEVTKETIAKLEAKGAKVQFLKGDLADLDGHAALAKAAWNAFGGIDCLVNNAGVAPLQLSDVLTLTPEAFEHTISVNLRGTLFLSQAIGRLMKDAEPAQFYRSMVFITSIAANHVSVAIPDYCISKAGLSMVSGLFALTLADAGIHVHEVRPGFINTDMTSSESEGSPREAIEAHLANGDVPLNRWGEEHDVGRSVATLASGDMPYAVGHPVFVDGGYGIATA